MPPLPVIPSVFRISLIWTLESGVRPVNVLHVRAPGYTVLDLAEELEEKLAAGGNNPFATLANAYSLDTINILPLDGTTPTYVHTVTETIAGGAPGEIVPAAAGVLSIRSTQRGPQGRGRLYLGPVGETTLSNGLIDGAKLTEAVAGWADMDEALRDLVAPIVIGVASYVHSDFNNGNGFSMRVQAGTVRRRQNQLL